jgi:hypothetical protein
MTEASAPSVKPGLTQIERVVNTFIAPTSTFEDIKRNASWWLPFLIAAVISLTSALIFLKKVGIDTFTNGVIAHSPRLADAIASNPAAEAHALSVIGTFIKVAMFGNPLISILVAFIVAGLFLFTSYFIFGGKATFGQMVAVWYYGTLPMQLYYLLGLFVTATGHGNVNFFARDPIGGTSIGYYLHAGQVPAPLLALLTAIDIFSVWNAVVLTIGVSTVAGIKRSAAAIVVFGWWGLNLLRIAGAALHQNTLVR